MEKDRECGSDIRGAKSDDDDDDDDDDDVLIS